ncbi:TetR/AcrR family transcriptional regulator [Paenibacillus sp. D2_2]|uniref:TetR/AcrR family transcriptional regulator n=1 Tax=Paenibacillus sp. D2_2 TaxID=3073092 RepID=UPI002816700D|nr:TetR/AcrR family transcriptional regulator [Paenibacillus sp. D2_2]WMT39884.1 TetR/AcrR family transcriptional regulator [Paenibacillus sp. D2_2]
MGTKWEQELDLMRQSRREQIMDAAYELVLEKGLISITIVDIVKKAEISRVTLYKYYSSIHEIVFDIQIKILNEMSELLGEKLKGKDGLEKLHDYFATFVRMYHARPDYFRFAAMFDQFYQSSYPTPELEERYQSFTKQGIDLLEQIIEEGMVDGSIRAETNPTMMAQILSHIMMGTTQRVAARNEIYKTESKVDSEEMLNYLADFLTTSLAATPSQA